MKSYPPPYSKPVDPITQSRSDELINNNVIVSTKWLSDHQLTKLSSSNNDHVVTLTYNQVVNAISFIVDINTDERRSTFALDQLTIDLNPQKSPNFVRDILIHELSPKFVGRFYNSLTNIDRARIRNNPTFRNINERKQSLACLALNGAPLYALIGMSCVYMYGNIDSEEYRSKKGYFIQYLNLINEECRTITVSEWVASSNPNVVNTPNPFPFHLAQYNNEVCYKSVNKPHQIKMINWKNLSKLFGSIGFILTTVFLVVFYSL